MSISPGQMMSHYRVVEKIGEGGMGTVYKALDTKLNRHVAIKVLTPGLAVDAERKLRFQREAQAAAALSYPSIAVIYEVGEHEGDPFIAMELLEGRNLRDLIHDRPLPASEWIRVSLPIAEGLAHAHEHGVIHRDLKPDNVIVTTDNQVKILDFGLAKLLEPESRPGGGDPDLHSRLETISQELTRAGKVYGTVAYMSPEQARGDAVDHRSDLFSLGIMLYEMASGRLPFKGDSQVETLAAIIKEEAPTLSEIARDVPAETERVVRKAMEKEPDRRYQHADELATDLRNLKRDLDSGRASIPTVTASGVSTVAAAPRRRPWVIGGIVAVVAVVLAAAGWLLQRGVSSPDAGAALSPDSPIAIVGFENLSDPEDSEHLGRALMGLITTDLAESGGLRVVSTSKVLASLRQAGGSPGGAFDAATATDAARGAGARVMLVGQLTRMGEGLLLAAELVDVESGDTVGSIKKEAKDTSELFSLAGAIAADVRKRIGPGGTGGRGRGIDLADALTSSPDAYRHYAVGEVALHELRWQDAIEHFERAIREDPAFALAYYRLATARWWARSSRPPLEDLEAGAPHMNRLPDRWRIVYQAMRDYFATDHDSAYEALTRLIETTRDIPDPFYILGEISFHIDRYRDPSKSREYFQTALDIDPSYKVVSRHLMDEYLLARDFPAAERLLARYKEEDPSDPAVGQLEFFLLLGRGELAAAAGLAESLMPGEDADLLYFIVACNLLNGDTDRAYELAEEAVTSASDTHATSGFSYRAQTHITTGRFREALSDLEEARRRDQSLLSSPPDPVRLDSLAHHSLDKAGILAMAGRRQEALEAVREAMRHPLTYPGTFQRAGVILLAAGYDAEAAEMHSRLKDLIENYISPVGVYWDRLLQARIEAGAGNTEQARAALEEALALPFEYHADPTSLFTKARVLSALGDRAGAINAYLEYRQPSLLARGANFLRWIESAYDLARLQEEAGDTAGARRHYRDFLDHWGEADLPIDKVADAKARLTTLEAR